MGEEQGAVEGLLLLWRRLSAEVQRMQASPAAALLDQVLRAMDPASGLLLQDRQQVFLIRWAVLFAVCCVLCAVCCVLCAVCCVPCAVCCMLCELDFQPPADCHIWRHIKLPYSLVQLQCGSNEYALQLA